MSESLLHRLLMKHLKDVGLPTDFTLRLHGYSEYYNGRYNTDTREVLLYHLEEDGSLVELDDLFATLRHEALHHFQWVHDHTFVRFEGVMHDDNFYRLEKEYSRIAKKLPYCLGRAC